MPILYVYEVQLEPAVQRKGLGVFLMTLLKLLAKKNQLKAIMLTVMNVSDIPVAKSTTNLLTVADMLTCIAQETHQ